MSQNGKGSTRRPRSPLVSEEEIQKRWDEIFKKEKKDEPEPDRDDSLPSVQKELH